MIFCSEKIQITIFEISALFAKKPPTYIIKDHDNEDILGKFYEKELRNVQIEGK